MRLFSIHFNFVKGILTRVFKSLCFVTKCLVLVAFLGYIFCFFLHWHVILLYGTILFNINIIFGLFLRSLFITEWASEFSAEMTASFFRCCLWLVDMIFKHCYYYPIYILISLYFRGFTTAVPHWACQRAMFIIWGQKNLLEVAGRHYGHITKFHHTTFSIPDSDSPPKT